MIDYNKLSDAIDYYKSLGYTYIDLPWTASEKAMNITLPKGAESMKCQVGLLVGSAEQIFLDKVMAEELKGKFVSCTPCFRKEEVADELHKYYFMKVELFINDVVNDKALHTLIEDCLGFYNKYLPAEVVKTEEGCDIVDVKNKIELGSYSIRDHNLVGRWVNGTGLAEGRLSYVIGKQ